MTDKFEHVREAIAGDPAPAGHGCHWPGCVADVPPAAWGCRKHWFSLPRGIRAAIWAAYRPGQETTKTPSAAYMTAARAAQDWIAANE